MGDLRAHISCGVHIRNGSKRMRECLCVCVFVLANEQHVSGQSYLKYFDVANFLIFARQNHIFVVLLFS